MTAAKVLIVGVMTILTLLVLGAGLISLSEYGGPPVIPLFLAFAAAWIIGLRAIIQARRRPDAPFRKPTTRAAEADHSARN